MKVMCMSKSVEKKPLARLFFLFMFRYQEKSRFDRSKMTSFFWGPMTAQQGGIYFVQ